MKDDSEKLSDTVSLCATVRLALGYFEIVVVFEYFIGIDDRQNDLIQRLAEIPGSLLCDLCVLRLEL